MFNKKLNERVELILAEVSKIGRRLSDVEDVIFVEDYFSVCDRCDNEMIKIIKSEAYPFAKLNYRYAQKHVDTVYTTPENYHKYNQTIKDFAAEVDEFNGKKTKRRFLICKDTDDIDIIKKKRAKYKKKNKKNLL
jgi:hypothetical protein